MKLNAEKLDDETEFFWKKEQKKKKNIEQSWKNTREHGVKGRKWESGIKKRKKRY